MTWEEFVRLPERTEVVLVPPARPIHIKLQKQIERLLESATGDLGVVTIELHSSRAMECIAANEYPVYTPALIVEVLSPSNTPPK